MRLQSTSIRTTIRHDKRWRRHQFSWVNEWEECTTGDGRVEGMEIVLSDWFYRGVRLLAGPRHRRGIFSADRKDRALALPRRAQTCGRQWHGWRFDFAHLHEKSGSLARLADFAFDLRRIAGRQPIPGYRLLIEREGRRELLRIVPADLSTGLVDKPYGNARDFGNGTIGTPGVKSAAKKSAAKSLARNGDSDPNKESNILLGRGSAGDSFASEAITDPERRERGESVTRTWAGGRDLTDRAVSRLPSAWKRPCPSRLFATLLLRIGPALWRRPEGGKGSPIDERPFP
ncbi:Plasmid replication initiator protein [Candidatus Paraburkholderia calva]|nr:Plasmid replication initiator protein [Candidatus Paraburkholderia calva]